METIDFVIAMAVYLISIFCLRRLIDQKKDTSDKLLGSETLAGFLKVLIYMILPFLMVYIVFQVIK